MDVVRGNFAAADGLGTSQVRVFLSSTFTDTSKERDAILGRAVPRVKVYAKRFGYEFSPASMQWGVTKAHANNHQHAELCIKELESCMELSEGVSFVSLIGQKYGFRPFPAQILASEFEQIRSAVAHDEEKLGLLDRLFVRDDNFSPPKFVLVPITSVFPDYGNEANPEASKEASAGWWDAFARLQRTLREGAHAAHLPEEEQRKYHISVTEHETVVGLSGKSVDETAVWFKRTFAGLDESKLGDPATPLFIDVLPSGTLDAESRSLLDKQKNDLMHPRIANVKEYKLSEWSPKLGLDPAMDEHKRYLDTLCQDFEAIMTASIDRARSRASALRSDSIYVEAAHHATICRERCKSFHSREDILASIKGYIDAPPEKSLPPLVVFGESGSGKTSVMAKAAMNASLANPLRATVLRFIGTSSHSSAITQLLRSLCQHLCRLYEPEKEATVPQSLSDLTKMFEECLTLASAASPVVILLDSLDQLAPEGGARQLRWLPMKPLPAGVRIVVSTLPEDKYTCFPILKHALKANPELFVQVPRLDPSSDGAVIIDDWLYSEGRTLTPAQRTTLMDACRGCPLPLYLKLAVERALQWPSFAPPQDTQIPPDVRSLINKLFSDLESEHGVLFISRALGLITAAKRGLSLDEIEDLISCDDEVLDQIFEYWMPPFRRIPPLLWARVRRKLGAFFVERGSGASNVLAWHHRQFAEAAEARYLQDPVTLRQRHSALADLFLGTWAGDVEKPFENSAEKIKRFGLKPKDKASRNVAPQPLVFEEGALAGEAARQLNTRKLDELLPHLVKAGRFEEAVRHCLANFDFLLCKMRAFGAYEALLDFDCFLDDPLAAQSAQAAAVGLISSAIRMSPADPEQLGTQLVGRLSPLAGKHPVIKSLLDQARASTLLAPLTFFPVNMCLNGPGGALKQTFGHPDKLWTLAASPDGRFLMTGCDNRKAYVWDLKTAEQVAVLADQDWMVRGVAVSHDSSVAASAALSSQLMIWDAQTWAQLADIPSPSSGSLFCERIVFVPGSSRFLAAAYSDLSVKIWDLETKTVCKTFGEVSAEAESGKKAADVAITSNGRVLAAAIVDKIHVFDYESTNLRYPAIQLAAACNALCISPDDKTLFAVSETVEAYRLESGQQVFSVTVGDGSHMVLEAIAVNESVVAVAGSDQKIHILEHNGKVVRSIDAHSDWIKDLVLLKNRSVVMSVSQDRTARVFDYSVDGAQLPAMTKHAAAAECVAATQDFVFSAQGSQGNIFKWSAKTGERVSELPMKANEVFVMPDGQRLVCANGIYDLDGRQLVGFKRAGTYAYSMAIAPDQSRALFTAIGMSPDSVVYSLNLRQGAIGKTEMSHDGLIRKVCMSPAGNRVLTVGDDAKAKLWSWPECELLHSGALQKIGLSGAISPDGKYALVTTKHGSAKVFSADTGAELFSLAHMAADGNNFNRIVLGTCFTADARYAVTGGRDRHLKFWDVQSGRLVYTITFDSSIEYCISGPTGFIAVALGGGEIAILTPSYHMQPCARPVVFAATGGAATLGTGSDGVSGGGSCCEIM